MHTTTKPILSVVEAADFLGITTVTLRKLIAGGDLKASRVGSLIRIQMADVRSYLDSNLWDGPLESKRHARKS